MANLSVSALGALVYETEPVALYRVKAGDRIEFDGRLYKVFRFIRVVKPHKPLGCAAIAVPYDALGKPMNESVVLNFESSDEIVRLVCVAGVAR